MRYQNNKFRNRWYTYYIPRVWPWGVAPWGPGRRCRGRRGWRSLPPRPGRWTPAGSRSSRRRSATRPAEKSIWHVYVIANTRHAHNTTHVRGRAGRAHIIINSLLLASSPTGLRWMPKSKYNNQCGRERKMKRASSPSPVRSRRNG